MPSTGTKVSARSKAREKLAAAREAQRQREALAEANLATLLSADDVIAKTQAAHGIPHRSSSSSVPIAGQCIAHQQQLYRWIFVDDQADRCNQIENALLADHAAYESDNAPPRAYTQFCGERG